MELVTYITQAEEKANGRTKLAQFLEVRPNYLTDAKAGRCGLPAYACVKLAQLLGEDPTRVIAGIAATVEGASRQYIEDINVICERYRQDAR